MKNVIVTGASRGIGRGISLDLAKKGCRIAAVGVRPESDVGEYLSELRALSPDSFYVSADISDEDAREKIVSEAFGRMGKVDILVNNAGIAPKVREDILHMKRESMDRLIETNLKGTFFLTQKVANGMIGAGCGEAIIFITSMSAYVSSTSRGEYCVSKAGLSMTATLFADRLAEYGINVYEIRPGIIETDMTAVVKDKYIEKINNGLLPIKRMGKPEDIAAAVSALAFGALPYSTGEVINIDGGFHIRSL
ncbi:MAG: 3-ketoacyl-ACP reductase [Clostridia bacterium]|nr:3-ketoacyl-ACP reductase [Clostridia bacterium]